MRVAPGKQRVELRPARLFHAEESVHALQFAERIGGVGSLCAIQIERAANAEVTARFAALAHAEAMEHLDLQAGEEMRHPVARHEYRHRVPVDDRAHRFQAQLTFLKMAGQVLALQEPRGVAAAGADCSLQRAQDRERVELRNEQQIARHGASPARMCGGILVQSVVVAPTALIGRPTV